MCCFSGRKTPACIVFFLSFLAVAAGIMMIVFAARLQNSEFLDKVQDVDEVETAVDLKKYRNLFFIGLVLFALIAIVAAIMGIGACKIKHRCYTCCYGLLLLPTWIMIILIGTGAVFVSYASEDVIEDKCAEYMDKFETGIDNLGNKITDLTNGDTSGGSSNPLLADNCAQIYDTDVPISMQIYDSLLINEEMCSINCPCKPVDERFEWVNLNRAEIGRCRDWDFTGTITTYKECLQQPGPQAKIRYQGFAEGLVSQDSWDGIADFIEFFENQLDCAGICRPALFSFSKSIENGRPNNSCVKGLMENIDQEFVGLSAATLISGILLFFIWIMQYCLWKKY